MSGIDLKEFLAAYLAEVGELVSSANASLLAIDAAGRRSERSPKAVREVYRAVHTIKGLSAMVGVEPIVELAHRMESQLRVAAEISQTVDAVAIDVLLQGLRTIEESVRALAAGAPVPPPPRELLDALDALRSAPSVGSAEASPIHLEQGVLSKLTPLEREQIFQAVATGRRVVRVDFEPTPERAARGLSITSVRERIAKYGEIIRVLPTARKSGGGVAFTLVVATSSRPAEIAEVVDADPAAVEVVAEPPPAFAPLGVESIEADGALRRQGVLRVDVSRLDAVMESLSALVVHRYRLTAAIDSLRASGANVRELLALQQDNRRQIRDLRAAILRLRMVPVTELFDRIPLLVRGIARATGKQAAVAIDAGGAELDKAVTERLFPAVVHLVRNMVDHGIEMPDERRRAGKPEEGALRIEATAAANARLELTLSDDGAGIDLEGLASRAGRPTPATEEEILDLLAVPGLSSRDEATSTSGRGMGMDIVRRIVVEELGGELHVSTAKGKGTRFTLKVPLTVSVMDAFTFECAHQRFAVPVAMVEEILEVDTATLADGPHPEGGPPSRVIERHGEVMPLLALDRLFGLPAGDGPAVRGGRAIVVRRANEPVAFGVDRMLGQQEVMVRPVEDPLVHAVGISGTTDLGDGRPTLVLDLVSLYAQARARAEASA